MKKDEAVIVRVSNGVAYADDKSRDSLAAFSFGKIEGKRLKNWVFVLAFKRRLNMMIKIGLILF